MVAAAPPPAGSGPPDGATPDAAERRPRWPRTGLLRGLRLSTRLALVLTGTLLAAAVAEALLYVRTRNETLQEAQEIYQTLADAIQVGATQMGADGWKDERLLQDFVSRLRARGLREIRVTEGGKPFPDTPAPTPPPGRRRGKATQSVRDVEIYGVVGDRATSGELKIPMVVEGRYLGDLRIGYSQQNMRDKLEDNFRRRIYALLGVFALGLAVILVLTHSATRPMDAIAEAASRVAEGRYDVTVPVEREDEVGRLAATFNRMTAALRERQELEARLAAAERRAEIGHLASGLAHEIKNPLNALSLGLDVLRRRHRPPDPTAATEYGARIENLRAEIDRLTTLINNFLAFGRPLALSVSAVDLVELVRGTVRELAETAEQAGVALAMEAPDGLPRVRGDGSLLKSAVWNLVQNAVQAHEAAGGTIRVAVGRDTSGPAAPPRLAVTVEDEGSGIDPTNLERLFEPYFSTKEAGVGLGLAMVRRIVEEHGGRVLAGNRPEGRGAWFRFTVPVASGDPGGPGDAGAAAAVTSSA